jgi:murein DD-endopeptidase MepM/ murein hydrolase activator NlpD
MKKTERGMRNREDQKAGVAGVRGSRATPNESRQNRFGRVLLITGVLVVAVVWVAAFASSQTSEAEAGPDAAGMGAGTPTGAVVASVGPTWLFDDASGEGRASWGVSDEVVYGDAVGGDGARGGGGSPAVAAPDLLVDFRDRLPELSEPEPEAKELLRMLEHLPAQPPVVAAVSSPYGWRRDPLGGREGREQFHRGIDFDVPTGTVVAAPAPGVVMSVQRGGGYGRYVKIKHGEAGYMTILAHLSEVATGIEAGARVERGQVVAYSGGGDREDGRSTGPHVHFEIRVLAGESGSRETVDPALVFDVYWETWDRVQDFALARTHASFAPYILKLDLTP